MRAAFANGRGEGERLAPFAPLMAPGRVRPLDRIAQEQDELDSGIVGVDALERLRPIDIDGRRLAANLTLAPAGKVAVILPVTWRRPVDRFVVEEMHLLGFRQADFRVALEQAIEAEGSAFLHAGDEKIDARRPFRLLPAQKPTPRNH
jgi:hypothetical protein